MTNWHHNLHLDITPLAATDISTDMLQATVGAFTLQPLPLHAEYMFSAC